MIAGTWRRNLKVSAAVAGTSALVAGFTLAPTAFADASTTENSGALSWAVKTPLLDYLAQGSGDGTVSATGDATYADGVVTLPVRAGASVLTGDSGELSFKGGLTFQGQSGLIETEITDVRLDVDGTAAQLIADVASRSYKGTDAVAKKVTYDDIPLLSITLGTTPDFSSSTVDLGAVAATLTEQGVAVFGSLYDAGTSFDLPFGTITTAIADLIQPDTSPNPVLGAEPSVGDANGVSDLDAPEAMNAFHNVLERVRQYSVETFGIDDLTSPETIVGAAEAAAAGDPEAAADVLAGGAAAGSHTGESAGEQGTSSQGGSTGGTSGGSAAGGSGNTTSGGSTSTGTGTRSSGTSTSSGRSSSTSSSTSSSATASASRDNLERSEETSEAASVCTDEDSLGIQESTATWGVKESFRSYITGSIAKGSWELNEVEEVSDGFSFTGENGAVKVDSRSGTIIYPGTMRFTGHEGILDLTIANIEIRFTGDTGQLIAAVTSSDMDGNKTDYGRVALGDLEFSSLDVSDDSAEGEAKVLLTSEGSSAFAEFYQTGQELDPISFTATLSGQANCTQEQAEDPDANDDGSSTDESESASASGGQFQVRSAETAVDSSNVLQGPWGAAFIVAALLISGAAITRFGIGNPVSQ